MTFNLESLDSVIAHLDGGSPQGEDVKYDPLFFELQSEVENIASGNADWEKIEGQCIDLLAEKTKDLRVLAYLTAALTKRHGFAGLAGAITVTKAFIEQHWEGLHPARARQRGSALEWILIRVPDYVDEMKANPDDRGLLDQISEDVRWLDPELRKLLGPDAPSFLPLIGPLEQHRRRLGPDPATTLPEESTAAAEPVETEPSPPAEPQPPATTAETPAQASEEASDAASSQSPTPALRHATASSELPTQEPLAGGATVVEVKNRVRSLVPFLRKADPGNPLSYRLSRLIKWSELTGPPPPDAKKGGDATLVPVPRQKQREALEGLLEAEQWPLLLETAESAFQADSGTFWLDLHRYSVLALQGTSCNDAAEIVIGELRELLGRFPTVLRLCFAGGEIPFADPTTRRWIEESVRKVDVSLLQAAGQSAAGSMLDDEETQEVQALFAKKNYAGALQYLQAAIAKAPTASSRFQTRLAAARLCLETHRLSWARNLLEDLAKEARAFDFESWEPDTAVQLFQLQALCYGKLSRAAEGEESARLEEDLAEAQARLFRLDLRPIALIEDALGDDAPRGSWWRLGRS